MEQSVAVLSAAARYIFIALSLGPRKALPLADIDLASFFHFRQLRLQLASAE